MSAQEYAGMVNSGSAPWLATSGRSDWSDSTKEQYFSLLNADTANERELNMWRLNNEYNTPKSQMERMIEAGLNPAAAYSQVNAGNSSSVPNTHEAKAANFHDTQDKLAKINTIMNGVSSIMSTIYGGIDAVKGIQDIQFGYQNNWYDQMRAQAFKSGFYPFLTDNPNEISGDRVEVAPGLYASGTQIQMFPEMYQGFKGAFASGSYHNQQSSIAIQKDLAERRTRIDNLIQNIFKGLENNASNAEMIRMFMELFAYASMSKYGGY